MKFVVCALTLLFVPPIFAQTIENRTDYERDRSSAGLFVEPLVQLSREESEIKTSALPLISDNSSGYSEGAGFGLRLGGHIADIIFLAADARYSKLKFSDSAYGRAEGIGYNYGPALGVQTPFLGIRIWGSYILGGEYDPDVGSNRVDAKFTEATGPRLGVGVRVAMLSINLEYEDLKYNNTNIESVGDLNLNSSTELDLENKGYLLSVSFPISL